MSFHEESLPLAFALGAHGGPERRIDITALASGHESRNTPWAHGRRRFDIGGAVRSLDQLHALVVFFEARRGKLHGFRFRDFLDWKSCAPSQTQSAADQIIGAGDELKTQFQLIKTYGAGGDAYVRPIKKPKSEGFVVAIGGVVGCGGFSVDARQGDHLRCRAAGGARSPRAFCSIRRCGSMLIDWISASMRFGAGPPLSVPLIEILSDARLFLKRSPRACVRRHHARHVWLITRRDDAVFGFTDHDQGSGLRWPSLVNPRGASLRARSRKFDRLGGRFSERRRRAFVRCDRRG